jgi:hypothetical protein
VEKQNIAIGFSEFFYKYYPQLKKNSNYFELYLDYNQWKEEKDNLPKDVSINFLFNIIPDKSKFLNEWEEKLKIVKEVNPDYVTTSSYSFGRILAQEGFNVEASVVNNIDSLDKVYELSKLGYKGYTLSHDKIYDFKLMEEIKKHFPEIRMKIIPNMMCPQCIMYTERHECFYFNDSNDNLMGTKIDYHCEKNPLISSIIWPSVVERYKHVDVLKFASRKNFEQIYIAICGFMEGDDRKYLENMFNFYFRQFEKTDMVEFFLKEKKLCNFRCWSCPHNCSEKFKQLKA